MKQSVRDVKIVEWSEEDQVYVGSAPGLILGGCPAKAGTHPSIRIRIHCRRRKIAVISPAEACLGPRRRPEASQALLQRGDDSCEAAQLVEKLNKQLVGYGPEQAAAE